jgi:hypothetical protein
VEEDTTTINNTLPSNKVLSFQTTHILSLNLMVQGLSIRYVTKLVIKLCYHRMDFSYQGIHPPTKLAVVASTSNSSQVGDSWLPDMGATDHLTANVNNMTTPTT